MRQLISQVWDALTYLLYQRIVLVLTLLFCAGVAAALWNTSRLSSNLIESQAFQNASLYAQAINEARTLYSSEAVDRVKETPGITITHDYASKEQAIPLPATFLIELGLRIGANNPGMSVRLFSDYPFPWRRTEGGPKDSFEIEALRSLTRNPKQRFARMEELQGKPVFRYAQAEIMRPSCVSCHNTHPQSPKKDWKVGDVRGVLEITQPLDSITQQVRVGLKETFVMLALLSGLALSGLTLVIGRLRRTSKELEKRIIQRTAALQQTNEELEQEQEKSERLLLNILPAPIAKQLKEGHSNIADRFDEVTILFADIVGFTQLSAQTSPTQLVNLLNEIFSMFDQLTDRYGLEKIKTIGDAYMVVGGLPTPRNDHAEAIAEMALDIQQQVASFNERYNTQLNLRMGINTGPVIAGVIGTKKFSYDLWGDAVNTASRMESQGMIGRIQVSESTYKRLRDKYHFEERGFIPIKGKGEMKTYLLVGKVSKLLVSSNEYVS